MTDTEKFWLTPFSQLRAQNMIQLTEMAWTRAVAPWTTKHVNNTGLLPNLEDKTEFSYRLNRYQVPEIPFHEQSVDILETPQT